MSRLWRGVRATDLERGLVRLAFWIGLGGVLLLSLLPNSALPPVDPGWDKANHIAAFAVLGLLGWRSFPQARGRLLVMLLFYGLAIEGLQSLTADRQAEWLDVVADAVGLALALAVVGLARLPASWRTIRQTQ